MTADDPMVEWVCHALTDLLGQPVAPGDRLRAVGGDSLLAVRLAVRVRRELDREVPIATILRGGTIADLGARIAATPVGGGLPALARRDAPEPTPVTLAQAKALLFSGLQPDVNPYQTQMRYHFLGAFDRAALEAAHHTLIARHEILRARFRRRHQSWVLKARPESEVRFRLKFIDVSMRQQPLPSLERIFARAARQRLDPARWAWRAVLVRVAADHHVLIHVKHHVVHDGWTTWRLYDELVTAYQAHAAGREPELPALEFQYADYAHWQHAFASTAEGQRQARYWDGVLTGAPDTVLPTDRVRTELPTFRGRSPRVVVPDDLVEALDRRADQLSITPFALWLAAYATMLSKITGETDLVIGSGFANRRLPGTQELLGMLVNTVPLRINLADDPSPDDLAARVHLVVQEAQANQELPFEQVVQRLQPARSLTSPPYYRTLFSFHDSPLQTRVLDQVTVVPDDGHGNGSCKADLNLVVIRRSPQPSEARGLGGARAMIVFEHDAELIEESTAQAWSELLLESLRRFAEPDPATTIATLDLGNRHSRELVLSWSGTPGRHDPDGDLAATFARVASGARDAVAVRQGEQVLSYHELARDAARLAHRLRGFGVRPGDRVGLLVDRSVDQVVAIVAVTLAGAAYVPLDPTTPQARIREQLALARCELVLTLAKDRDLPDWATTTVVCLEDHLDLGRQPGTPPPVSRGPEDLAYVMFTSGSTGPPKPVAVPDRAILRLVAEPGYVVLDRSTVMLGMANAAFDAATFEIWGALLNGGSLVLAPPGVISPRELAGVVAEYGVNTMWLTAGLFQRVVDSAPELVSGVTQLLAGGDVLSPGHVAKALELLPPGGRLVNGYGPTETTTFATTQVLSRDDVLSGRVPIGRPVPGTRCYVLGVDDTPVPPGVLGRLWVGGDGVSLGYLDDPEGTAARFRPDPFTPGGTRYDTGDLARWRPDGTLDFCGRADRQVKIRGHRVEPAEVERILRSHPEVRDVAVVARAGDAADRVLVAHVVPTADRLDPAELRAHCARVLPPYSVPAAWHRLSTLPVTANGKVDLAALAAADLVTEQSRPALPPENATERRLLAVWQEVLDQPAVGVSDDFFTVGGHSLLAVALVEAIEREFGTRPELATLFTAPTIRQQARLLIQEGLADRSGSLVPLATGGDRPPLYLVTAGDGNATGFVALQRRLGEDQPVFAFQPRGLDGRAPFHRTVPAMARYYLKLLLERHPVGVPIRVGGRCLGALVAYEMARLLEARGRRPDLVLLLDSGAPQWELRPIAAGVHLDPVMVAAACRGRRQDLLQSLHQPDQAARLLRWLAEPVRETADGICINRYLDQLYTARADLTDLFGGQPNEGRLLVEWAWTHGRAELQLASALLPHPASFRPLAPARRVRSAEPRVAELIDLVRPSPQSGSRRRRRLRRISREAATAYRAGRYGGEITLARSQEYREDPVLDGWYGLDTAGVVELPVAGTHRSMLREPDVADLAATLRQRLDELDDGSRSAEASR